MSDFDWEQEKEKAETYAPRCPPLSKERFSPNTIPVVKRSTMNIDQFISNKNKLTEKLLMWIAWHLPKKLVMWCAIRLMADATMRAYPNHTPDEVSIMQALSAWDDNMRPK